MKSYYNKEKDELQKNTAKRRTLTFNLDNTATEKYPNGDLKDLKKKLFIKIPNQIQYLLLYTLTSLNKNAYLKMSVLAKCWDSEQNNTGILSVKVMASSSTKSLFL